jgi:hypothetical protein
LRKMDWLPVSVHNFVLVHVSTPKGDLSKAHVLRVWPSTQAPPSAHSGIWTAALGMRFGDNVCNDCVCHCWHSPIALHFAYACSFRANDETIVSTGLKEQCLSTCCPLGAGLTNNEDLLDECGSCLPPFSFSYARDFDVEIACAQTVFVGAQEARAWCTSSVGFEAVVLAWSVQVL